MNCESPLGKSRHFFSGICTNDIYSWRSKIGSCLNFKTEMNTYYFNRYLLCLATYDSMVYLRILFIEEFLSTQRFHNLFPETVNI